MTITLNGTTGITSPGGDTSTSLSTGSLVVSGTSNTSALTVGNVALGAGNATRFKNRIINGDMRISQRGTSFTNDTTGTQYSLDRWLIYGNNGSKFTVAQSSTAPAGFANSLLVTSSAATSIGASDVYEIIQRIEGFNFADMAWGTANAKTVTLSFWVYSSLTGTFGGSLANSANTRSYPFSYTVSSANTWTQISVTIAGDTTGTWIGSTNGIGVQVIFGLGVGSTYSGTVNTWAGANYSAPTGAVSVVSTNGATWYITGVQLEVGSSATGFEYLDYGTELIMCQRYLPAWNWQSGNDNIGIGYSFSTTQTFINISIPVTPRTIPTGVSSSGLSNMVLRNASNSGGAPTAIAINVASSGTNQTITVTTTAGSPTISAGQGAFMFATAASQILFTGCEL